MTDYVRQYTDQVVLRVQASDKQALKHAASARGISLAAFIREAAMERAESDRLERINAAERAPR